MSLINQMLQDLEQRRADDAPLAMEQMQVRAVPAAPRLPAVWWLVLLPALLIGGGVGVGLWWWLRAPPPVATPVVAAVQAAAPQARVGAAIAGAAAASPEPAPVASAPAAAVATTQPEHAPVAPAAAMPAPEKTAGPTPPALAVAIDKVVPAATPVPLNVEPTPKPTPTPTSTPRPAPPATPLVVAEPKPADKAETQAASAPLTKEIRALTPQQQAENDFRRAVVQLQQGNAVAAQGALEQALHGDPRHTAARQTLAGLLLDAKRPQAAINLLQAGLELDPAQVGMAMILARVQVEQGGLGPALDTLRRSLPHAAERADYQAFLAALLQRDGRHLEAIEHYRQALHKAPDNGLWWMGLGISLRDAARPDEAREAFGRAAASNTLTPQLQAFVEQQLRQLPPAQR